jgi:outer membrane protein assembly factor BamB
METKKLRKNSYEKALTVLLATLLLTSSFTVLAMAGADTSSTSTSTANLLQYEWRETGANSENTRSSDGPAPNTPNVLWSVASGQYPGQPAPTGVAYAWDGKIFSFSGSWIGAYDPFTGSLLWNITMPSGWSAQSGTGGTPQAFRIDNTYGGIWTSRGPVFFNYKTGTIAGLTYFNQTQAGRPDISLGGGSVFYYAGFYNEKAKVFVRYARIMDTNEHGAVAFDCSNPTQPATLKWIFRADTGVEILGSYQDIIFLGGYGEGEVYAVNATTGTQLWMQWKNGNAGYSGTGYEGLFIHGASSVFLTGYNVTDGSVAWDYNAGERAYFVYGGCAAYGRYYATNIAVDPSGYFGCWEAATGNLLWKTPALWNIAYLTPCVADGKVYCQRFSGTAAGITAEVNSFMCMDAFTGQIIWELPGISLSHPMVAYGNLYGVFNSRLYCISDRASQNAWPEWHGTPSNNGIAVGQHAPQNISIPKWTYATYGPITGSPVAADGKVYFGSFDQNLYCVDANTGAKIWNYTVGYRIRSTPAVVGGTVYLGPDDGYIYSFNANTGQRNWKTPAPGAWTTAIPGEIVWTPAWQPRSSPIVDSSGRLYVGSMDGKVYCLNANSGTIVWTQAIGNATFPVGGTPCIANNTCYIAGGVNGSLYAFDSASGSMKWKTSLNSQRSAVSTPIAYRDYLFVGNDSGTHFLQMLNATNGASIATASLNLSTGSTPAVFTPTFRPSTLVEVANQTNLGNTTVPYIINATTTRTYDMVFAVEGMTISAWAVFYDGTNIGSSTGSGRFVINGTKMVRIWYQWIGHQIFSSLTYAEDLTGAKIYGGSDVNSVSCLNATSGKALSSFSTGAPVFGIVAVYDNKLYAASHDKLLYCFEDPTLTANMNIYASASKYGEMWNNETMQIAGRLAPPVTGIYPHYDFGSFIDNGIPNATVVLSLTKPDGTSINYTGTSDNRGYFEFQCNMTEVGSWGWVAYYEGEAKAWITYLPAYSQWTPINVTAAPMEAVPTPTETPTTNPTPTPIVTAEPTETVAPTATPTTNAVDNTAYMYAAIAAIVIVIAIVAAYAYTKSKKKKAA